MVLSKMFYHGSKHDIIGPLKPTPSDLVDGESVVYATNMYWLAVFFASGADDFHFGSGFIDGNPYIIEKHPGAIDEFLRGKSGGSIM